MLLASVFLVSLSSLGIEILLTRAFSFSQWNHLSFMVISIVLFGFGASGSLLSLNEGRRPGRWNTPRRARGCVDDCSWTASAALSIIGGTCRDEAQVNKIA